MTKEGPAADKEGLTAVLVFTAFSLILVFAGENWVFWTGLGLFAFCMVALGNFIGRLSLIGLAMAAALGIYEGFLREETLDEKIARLEREAENLTTKTEQSNGTSAAVQVSGAAPERVWVTAERLNRRTCPSTRCGIVGEYLFRESVKVFDMKRDWARVTKYYDALCVDGTNQFVDSGDRRCHPDNGVVSGQFAEWVSTKYLSSDRPPDPATGATGDEALIAKSDDYRRYKRQFIQAAQTLIESGRCNKSDFLEHGGWVKSFSHKDRPVYFMYCGGSTKRNRIYLNAERGEIFR